MQMAIEYLLAEHIFLFRERERRFCTFYFSAAAAAGVVIFVVGFFFVLCVENGNKRKIKV